MSLREALASKRSQQTHYDLVIGDSAEPEAALQAAQAELRLARARESDEDSVVAARASVEEARAALQACLHRIHFQPLEPDVFEALVGAHPPTKAQRADGDTWNATTFRPALIAACAVDSELDETDWAVELASKRWSVADRDEIFAAALAANVVPRSLSVPKG
jgi:hypothetical protein